MDRLAPPDAGQLRSGWTARALVWAALAAVVVSSMLLTAFASRRNSTTFDEIVFMAVGARGFETGDFDLAPDHPPLMQYVYGLPLYLAGIRYPNESGVTPELKANPGFRYLYAQQTFYVENEPERLAFLGRLPAVLIAGLLVVLIFAYTRSIAGPRVGLISAAIMAFLPDLLAHGGVAYSDVPVTTAFLAGLWALDAALRRPGWRRAALAGLAAGLAVAVKVSAGALVPIALGLLVLEALARRGDRDWARRVALAAPIVLVAGYLTLVAVYRGDWLLEQFRWGLAFRSGHMSGGHGARQILLGDESPLGWWYFFPVAFLFKTSVGLHVLMLVAAFGFVRTWPDRARIVRSPLRAPVLAVLVFGGLLLLSNLNIGFRYAMPVLPPLIVLTAVGVGRAWRELPRLGRGVTALAFVATIALPVSWYPNFLSYISEYGPGRDAGHRVLVDSSLDWGQGLIQLREYMERNGIESVYLSYFGSAWPAGYGIRYQPLHSFFPLPAQPPTERAPTHIVISATNLRGAYFSTDPFSRFRDARPDAVVANTLYVFRLAPEAE